MGKFAFRNSNETVTDNELDNLHHILHRQFTGMPKRMADHAVVKIMAGEVKTRKDVADKFLPTVVEYTHDHWMGGEGGNKIHKRMVSHANKVSDEFFKLPPKTRNDVSEG